MTTETINALHGEVLRHGRDFWANINGPALSADDQPLRTQYREHETMRCIDEIRQRQSGDDLDRAVGLTD